MATEKLIAKLEAQVATPLMGHRFKLVVTKGEAGQSNAVREDDTRPAAPDVWLQVWRLGRGAKDTWQGPAVMSPPVEEDKRCIEVAGYVRKGSAGYQFCSLGEGSTQPGVDGRQIVPEHNGWVVLDLDDSKLRLLSPLHDPGVSPSVMLAAVLRDKPDDMDTQALRGAPALKVTNLVSVLLSQIAEGGLVVCLHPAIATSSPKVAADANFEDLATKVSAIVHALKVDTGGVLAVGPSPVAGGAAGLIDTLRKIRAAASKVLGIQEADAPKIKRLITLSRGRMIGPNPSMLMEVDDAGKEVWLDCLKTSKAFIGFMDGLAPHLTSDAVWAMLGPMLGAGAGTSSTGPASGDFGHFKKDGKPVVAPDAIGAGAFAERCYEEIAKRGLRHTAIWAHASTGHLVLNPELRAFTRFGNLDLCWMAKTKLKLPTSLNTSQDRVAWRAKFYNTWQGDAKKEETDAEDQRRCWQLIPAVVQNPSDAVRRQLGLRVAEVMGEKNFEFNGLQSLKRPPGPEDGAPIPAPKTEGGARKGGRVFLAGLGPTRDVIGTVETNPNRNKYQRAREEAIWAALKDGNLPDFCRRWIEIELFHGDIKASAWVTADCLAVGTNEDYIRVNLSAYTSEYIAKKWNCYLPTDRLALATLHQSGLKGQRALCHPLQAQGKFKGMHQASNLAMRWHDDIIQGRVRCDSMLTADQLKEVSGKFGPDVGEPAVIKRDRLATPSKSATSPPSEGSTSTTTSALTVMRCMIGTSSSTHPMHLVCGHMKEIFVSKAHDTATPSEPARVSGHKLYFHGFLYRDAKAESWPQADGYLKYKLEGTNSETGATNDIAQWLTQSSHYAGFTDYAQGTRLVYPWVKVEDDWLTWPELLSNSRLYALATQAGPFQYRVRYPYRALFPPDQPVDANPAWPG